MPPVRLRGLLGSTDAHAAYRKIVGDGPPPDSVVVGGGGLLLIWPDRAVPFTAGRLKLIPSMADISARLLPTEEEPIDYADPKIAFTAERCRGKRVLDIGCVAHEPLAVNNRYFMHRAIHGVAERVVGLDIHEPGVENMRARGYDVRVGNAEGFDLGERFDVIVAGDIVEHLANLDGFLRSCDAALAPGGIILVETPYPWYWRNIVKAVIDPANVRSNPQHTCFFDPVLWRQLVERYGFTTRNVVSYSRQRRDKWMPLPRGLKHSSWACETIRA